LSKTANIKRQRRQEKAKADEKQNILCVKEGTIQVKGNPGRDIKIEQKGLDPYKKVFCPFCFHVEKIDKFLLSEGKKGINKSKGKCPNCETTMMLETLSKTNKMKPQDYAKWVLGYRGFFFKLKSVKGGFEGWKTKLYERGWANDFWTAYKILKAEMKTERTQHDTNFDPNNYFSSPGEYGLKPNPHLGPEPYTEE